MSQEEDLDGSWQTVLLLLVSCYSKILNNLIISKSMVKLWNLTARTQLLTSLVKVGIYSQEEADGLLNVTKSPNLSAIMNN